MYAARAKGALGAMLSGAGGGDCMFAVADEGSLEDVKVAISSSGAEIVKYQTNASGVRIEGH
jgi:mevalonate kinase